MLAEIQAKIEDLQLKCFLEFLTKVFFSLVQFPSSCKTLDQTKKMPRNESKNEIIMVTENTFPRSIQNLTLIKQALDTVYNIQSAEI